MITITEKDGATIIVVENPNGAEKRVIEQAKNAKKAIASSVWSRFKCNQKKETNTAPESKPAETLDLGSLDDFETIYDPNEDVPF